jgi:hypothetical protein
MGVCALVGQYGITEMVLLLRECNNRISCRLYIHMWSYLFPMEWLGPIDTGCNRLMVVVRAIFS